MSNRLQGKVAVITGAASGFGAAMARRFAAEGCRVVLGDIQEAPCATLAREIGNSAVSTVCDVTREDDVAGLVDLAVERFEKLDAMVNNAGIIGAVGPIDTTPQAEWLATVDVLLNGVFFGMKHAARVMKPRRSGAILTLTSAAGLTGGLGPHAYAACKHAVVGLTRNVGAELCRHGIRVNAIAPGAMATAMVANVFTGDSEDVKGARRILAERSPLIERAGVAEDVANAALWLASDESGYTNGHVLTTDAGLTTGSTAAGPGFMEYQPMFREAGRKGL